MKDIKGITSILPKNESLLEFVKKASRLTFEASGKHYPMLIMRSGDKLLICMVQMENVTDKGIIANAMVSMASVVDEMVFACEAWVREIDVKDVSEKERKRLLKAEKDKYKNPSYSISKEPDRKEAIQLCHATPGGETMHIAYISRQRNRPPVLGDWESDGARIEGGRFSGLFSRATQHERN